MSNTLLTTFRRRVVVLLAAPLLVSSASAAAPVSPVALDGTAAVVNVDFRQTFYSDPAKTQQVGVLYVYCDGSYTMQGYETNYYKIVYYQPRCP
jgi:hypothetical protein